ncbi:patched domain-containing protein 3 [Plakobranchus ocellatus]|uniref:Patched domain-containing protein 3 n=1 Tax=Plakobranchus ocellatus TaxID=259542 RepID=A0AAV4DV07_9GAST|nr:patched domain-containing protein 3 [Plakobranchus ocellatus]
MEKTPQENSVGPVSNGYHGKIENGEAHAQTTQPDARPVSCLQKVSNAITGTLENAFERLGLSIGHHPARYIVGSVLVCLLCALGLIAFSEVSDPDDLWVPKDSQVLKDQDWIDENFPSTVRREQIIAESSNILTPQGMAALLDIYENSLTISSTNGITLSDVCINLIYGNSIDVKTYLGSRTTDNSGHITAAQAAIMTWITMGNDTMESRTEEWEGEFIDLGLAGHSDISTVYVMSGKSWQEESGKAIDGDVTLLSVGYFIVILFVLAVLGKFNLMEQRAWLTLGGFICIGLSILVSIGLSSAFQQGYGPLQSVLPFLLLGIGVDDMFVIMGALNNLLPQEQDYDIPRKIGEVLRHAGVSITVTSFTDFVAFMVGATTIIPALRSFCIYAAVGILALYALQAVFFTACLTFDLRRLQKQRDACCFCCVTRPSPPYTPNQCSQRQFVPFAFKHGLTKIITKLPFKIFTTVAAVSLLGVNIWGLVELEQYFDRNWFLPDDSYAKAFTVAEGNHFPQDGRAGYIYCGNLDYWGRKSQFEAMDAAMDTSSDILDGSTDSWFSALTSWLSSSNDPDVTVLLDASEF